MQPAMSGKDDPHAPGRAIPDAVRLNRDARRLIDPFNEKIGTWQSESVRLHAAVERMRQSGGHDPSLIESAAATLAHVEEQAKQFEAAVASAARELASHSRISDTRRSLDLIRERLLRCLP